MNPKVIISICITLTTLTACSGRAATTEQSVGKYQVSKTSSEDGKYKPELREGGRYLHMVQPYVHIHDNRELGTYQHIHVPYDGGYGPYAGLINPYEHDQSGNYEKYTVSNAEFKIPVLKLDYGFPDPPEVKKRAIDHQNVYHSSLGETTTTTTRRPPPTTTTTTTTIKPRVFNYHDEGGWRIIRQEEEKAKHKYDFLYLTENGIYGEEKAHLRKDAGTSATGYYEYTGDDGELYRVNYKSDERGFIPEADHIPTPPPIPDAIKRALEYVAKKKETHGLHTGQYDPVSPSGRPSAPIAPVRLQNMPTVDRPLPTVPEVSAKPALSVPPLPTFAPQARFTQYNPDNKYEPLPSGVGSPNSQLQLQNDYESTTSALKDEPVKVEEPQQEEEPLQQDQPKQEEPVKVEEPQKEEPLQQDQPQQVEPAKEEEPLQQDQPQQDEPAKVEEPLQQDQPQQDEPAKDEELPQSDQPQPDADPKVPQASEKHEEFKPPYQVPEDLRNEENFEYATA